MGKRKLKRRYRYIPTAKRIFLSLPAARLLLNALLHLEDAMIVSTDSNPNKALAHQTIVHLKTKLMDMVELEDWELQVPFDYNEKLITNAALHKYLIYLIRSGDTKNSEMCLLLCQQFSKLVAELQE